MLETLRSTSGQLRGAEEIPWSNKDEQGQTQLEGHFFPVGQKRLRISMRDRGAY